MIFQDTKPWINIIIFSVFFVLFLHAIEDPDIWFHMTIGRAVLDQGVVPTEEFYVFTRLGDASEFHEWGFGLIYHLVDKAFGLNGIIIFNALLGALTTFILFLSVRQRGLSIAVSLSAAMIGLWLIEFRFVQRPENFLYLAIATTIYFIKKYHQHGNWKYLIVIPVIGLVLSQIHPSVILLGLVIGTYIAASIICNRPNLVHAGQLGATLIATLLISLINPYGLEQLILPVKFSVQGEFLQTFTEFLPALSTDYAYRFIIAILIITFSLFGIRHRFLLAEWIMLAAFSYLAYQHVRDIALLGIALVLPFSSALDAILKSSRTRHIIAAGIIVFVAFDTTRNHNLYFGIDPQSTPVFSAETVAQYSQSRNILNFYHLGNYLAWRLGNTHKVIIDGRNFQDNKSLALHDALLSAKPGWQEALRRYDIDAIVTPTTLPYSGNFIPLAFELIRSSQWALLNREPAGVVFIRRDRVPDNTKILTENDLWLQAKSELITNLEYYPSSESSQKSLDRVNEYLQKH